MLLVIGCVCYDGYDGCVSCPIETLRQSAEAMTLREN